MSGLSAKFILFSRIFSRICSFRKNSANPNISRKICSASRIIKKNPAEGSDVTDERVAQLLQVGSVQLSLCAVNGTSVRRHLIWRHRDVSEDVVRKTISVQPRHCGYVTSDTGVSYLFIFNARVIFTDWQAINDKLQGSVAAYIRCGWVVNNQIKKCLLLSLSVNNCFKVGEYLAKLQAWTWLSHALSSSFSSVFLGTESAWDKHVFNLVINNPTTP